MSDKQPYFQQIWSKDQWKNQNVYNSVLTPITFFERAISTYPEKIGMVEGDLRLTYQQVGEMIYKLADSLIKWGLKKGDRVAILGPNTYEIIISQFAVLQAGGVIVPINTRLAPKEIEFLLDHSGSSVLITNKEHEDQLSPVLGHLKSLKETLWIKGKPAKLSGVNFDDFYKNGSPDTFVYPTTDENDMYGIYYTSGTTGNPKGVMLHHRQGYLNALGEMIEFKLSSESIYLWTLPIFHAGGWGYQWAVTGIGARHIMLPKVDPKEIFRLIEKEGVTHLCGAPTVLIMLIQGAPKGYKFPHKLKISTAGAPPPPAVIDAITKMNSEITHVYGLTETHGPHTSNNWKSDWDNKPDDEKNSLKARQGVGYVISPEVKVVDENMNTVPPDGKTIGEVVMRGNNVMKGYYNNPEATEEAFKGGWFHSGDLAVVHADGYIQLMDRGKDIIISGGENISSIEVEKVIYMHPSVLEASVIGVPNEKWGEVPKAFITLKEAASLTEEEIIAFCRANLSHFKCIKHAEIVNELPKTSTGKIQKFKLREKEWAGRDKMIN